MLELYKLWHNAVPHICTICVMLELYSVISPILITKKIGWPTPTLFLAPAEGCKSPSGPAEDLWPHLK